MLHIKIFSVRVDGAQVHGVLRVRREGVELRVSRAPAGKPERLLGVTPVVLGRKAVEIDVVPWLPEAERAALERELQAALP